MPLGRRIAAFFSFLLEPFVDRWAPVPGRCFVVDSKRFRTKNLFLLYDNPSSWEDVTKVKYSSNMHMTWNRKYIVCDPSVSGTFLILEIHDINDDVWKQWVKVMYANSKEEVRIGWIPRPEFIQLVIPRQIIPIVKT